MNRRTFLKVSTLAAGAAVGGPSLARAAREPVAPVAPAAAKPALMKVGCQRWGSGKLDFLLRNGVKNICASPAKAEKDGVWTVESVAAEVKRVKDAGLSADAMYWGVPLDVLVPARRDAAIDRCIRQIQAAGKGGIPCLAYNLHVRTWKARTGDAPGRGGATYSAWDLPKAEAQKGKPDIGPLNAEEHWDRITYFLQKVVPVATESKVKLACHPPDPPMPQDNAFKIAQVADTLEGLKKFVTTCESDCHGLTFCQGTVCEMLENPARDIYDAIRWFGQRKKIFQVHFRNIRGRRDKFQEVYVDDGDVDMFKALLVYREVGYDGMLMPDHVPHQPDDPEGLQAFSFAYGYIRGLIHAAGAA